MKKITIIGGGPAALMLAAHLDTTKYEVTIYDKKKSAGRKFLVAGEGGLNLTYSAPISDLAAQYSPRAFMQPAIHRFSNLDLIQWLATLSIETYVGSSKRVFPKRGTKPIEVLNTITKHLAAKGVLFRLRTAWTGWDKAGNLCFDDGEVVISDRVVFALGGASWKVTGSDGAWSSLFRERGVNVLPFRAANCAFGVDWGKNFINTHAGKPLKNIAITFGTHHSKGELVVSELGLEGNAIYALSESIQEHLLTKQKAVIHMDLKPSLTAPEIVRKCNRSKLKKVTDMLKTDLHLDRTAIGLLKLYTMKDTFLNAELLATAIKSLPIPLTAVDDIDKAISTLGGIDLGEVDEHFLLKKMPHTYAIGEMLDWYAPTGGYLLQGCFSMGYALAEHLNEE